jgi:hypothetical protein
MFHFPFSTRQLEQHIPPGMGLDAIDWNPKSVSSNPKDFQASPVLRTIQPRLNSKKMMVITIQIIKINDYIKVSVRESLKGCECKMMYPQ